MSGHLPVADLEAAFHGIFARQYYANNGPLVRELDSRLAAWLDEPHAVAVVNESTALMLVAKCLFPTGGEVIAPALAPPEASRALQWAGLSLRFADVDPGTRGLSAETVEPAITDRTVALLATPNPDAPTEAAGLQVVARRHGLRLLFDTTFAVGTSRQAAARGHFADATLVSFRSGAVLDAGEGACIATADPRLADMLRTARNFHASETFAEVPLRMNAKMSEAQAALALLALERLPEALRANHKRRDAYAAGLAGLDGVRLLDAGSEDSAAQVTIEVAAELAQPIRSALRDAGLPQARSPEVRGGEACPVAAELARKLLVLPSDPHIPPTRIDSVAAVIHAVASGTHVERPR